jgi:hypothetical protein
VIEDIEDYIIMQGFAGFKLTQADLERMIEKNTMQQRERAKMHQSKVEAN